VPKFHIAEGCYNHVIFSLEAGPEKRREEDERIEDSCILKDFSKLKGNPGEKITA
jgi:hypothetical protein